MSEQPTVTAVVIALNEAARLPGWLAAAAWADQRLVVDGGSTDATVEIARQAGACVLQRPFDYFTPQRNFALRQARSEWVMFVDADERPTSALAAEIRRRLPGCRQDAFRLKIRSSIFGRRFRFSGTQDDRPVRLVRRDRAEWIGGVHTSLCTPGPKGEMQGWIDHETMPDWASYWSKVERYTTLDAELRVAAGRPPVWHAPWLLPAREIARRLLWKHGWLDGPRGWAFCLASGLSEWELATKHRRLWHARHAADPRQASSAMQNNRRNWPQLGLSLLAAR
ncbi:MAG TPA: glycosyltransferase family 2 protein [Pirellulales bacterium]|jgi:glycosyltransferase involved in cell wall biosynthesis|nr:glycosyltransferase family 2 protein [Pirellulales bacterium]